MVIDMWGIIICLPKHKLNLNEKYLKKKFVILFIIARAVFGFMTGLLGLDFFSFHVFLYIILYIFPFSHK